MARHRAMHPSRSFAANPAIQRDIGADHSKKKAHRPFIIMFRTLPFLAFALLLGGCGEPTPKNKKDAIAEEIAKTRRAGILAEIADLGPGHPWAGDYYGGDGLGLNHHLALAPKNGFVFEWRGCLGLYDRNYGAVAESDGRIRMQFTFPYTHEKVQGLPESLTPILWSGRHYLVGEGGFLDFCNAFNADPAGFRPHAALLRKGDKTKPLRGKPVIPAEYARYLLDRPVTASVVAISEPITRTSRSGHKFMDRNLTLDAGAKSGLLPGMELHVIEPDSVCEFGEVIRVEENRCEVLISQDAPEELEKYYKRKPTAQEIERHSPAPSTRWRLSTRASYGRDLAE